MTVKHSYEIYREQYHRHLDEYMAFMGPIDWNMDKIIVQTKGNLLTLIRPDGGKMKLHTKQILGLLRYTGKRLQEIDEQETAT